MGVVASGHNDTTKTALQNLINNRKLGNPNVMQSVQQQMSLQQSQNADLYNQQRAYSQVAPNVNLCFSFFFGVALNFACNIEMICLI